MSRYFTKMALLEGIVGRVGSFALPTLEKYAPTIGKYFFNGRTAETFKNLAGDAAAFGEKATGWGVSGANQDRLKSVFNTMADSSKATFVNTSSLSNSMRSAAGNIENYSIRNAIRNNNGNIGNGLKEYAKNFINPVSGGNPVSRLRFDNKYGFFKDPVSGASRVYEKSIAGRVVNGAGTIGLGVAMPMYNGAFGKLQPGETRAGKIGESLGMTAGYFGGKRFGMLAGTLRGGIGAQVGKMVGNQIGQSAPPMPGTPPGIPSFRKI